MSTDKLTKMARAAGFAMACEDTPSTVVTTPARQPQSTARSGVPNVAPATALVPTKAPRISFAWGFTGFSFWKTA